MNRPPPHCPRRPGMVLIIVVVVVVMLSLAGLSFVVTMQTENRAAHVQGRQVQIAHVAGSGAELVKTFCQQPWAQQQEAGGAWDNATLFRDVLVFDDLGTGRHGRFSVISPRAEQRGEGAWRFGLENESAKLPLGALLRWDAREPGAAQRALLALPGMTTPIADAILDWLDPDDAPRAQGAEAEHYQGLGVPYGPRNGVPQCLEELLLIRDVTRELVFGAESDGTGRPARTGADPPWATLLTVCSAERNESLSGRPRINVNQDNLVELHQQLAENLDRAAADFIVLYRQRGPDNGPNVTGAVAPAVDPAQPAKVQIESLLELVDAKVRGDSAEGAPVQLAVSPWTSDALSVREALPKLWDAATTTADKVLDGRVNVNLAPRAVLLAVPGVDATLADRIVATRAAGSSREDTAHQAPTWLLAEGLVDLPKMKALQPYLTCGGDVVRAQILGYFDEGGPSLRAELAVDATSNPPRQVYWKDLRLLTRGDVRTMLGGKPPLAPRPSFGRRRN